MTANLRKIARCFNLSILVISFGRTTREKDIKLYLVKTVATCPCSQQVDRALIISQQITFLIRSSLKWKKTLLIIDKDFFYMCLGDKTPIEVIFKYIQKLVSTKKNEKFFSFFWASAMTHLIYQLSNSNRRRS